MQQDDQYLFQPLPSLGQLFVIAFIQTATTQLAKYAATEAIRELIEQPRRKRHYRRKRR
jgi:hypothetical protein